MPHEMDRQQAAQAQQLMMQQQQQYAYAAQNQHWQQPTHNQNMGYATYGMATAEYDKPANGGYTYTTVDPTEYYASQRAAAAQQQYMQQFTNPAMFAAQQQQQFAVASYGQMADRGSAANFNPGAPPPQSQGYPRPPPAVKRAGEAGESGIHGSPLSVFENQQSSAAYTASWVSSTSSLPPDMKESPEDAHLSYHQAASHAARGTVPGNEWVQPGGGVSAAAVAAATAADYGGTWGERRDENMFAAVHSGSGAAAAGGVGSTAFDHSQFARMNIDDNAHNHHHQQQQSYSSAALGNSGMTSTGGEWNSPEKNHPQQGIKFQTNAWQTNNLNQGQAPPQPLMMLAPQPMNQHQQQSAHQKGGKPMGGGFSPMGGKQQQQQQPGVGGPRGDGGYNKDGGNTVLSWEERLRKAQGAKERAEGGTRQFGTDANGGVNGGGQREGGPPRGRGGGGSGGGRGRGRGGERSYGDRAGGDGGQSGGEHRGGWKGGLPNDGVAQAQQGGDAGAFPMMPFGMQGMQGGGWRGGMRGNGGYMRGSNGGGMPNMHMQMRGAAAAAARGAPHPMMMRGPMAGGFPMMAAGPGGVMGASPMQQQDERFRSTWLDATMCLPTLMGIPGPMQMNPMMGGGFGGVRGGPRGGYSSPRGGRGGRGSFRGGRGPYNRDRQSPRQDGVQGEEAKEDERTPVDSPVEPETVEEEQQQE